MRWCGMTFLGIVGTGLVATAYGCDPARPGPDPPKRLKKARLGRDLRTEGRGVTEVVTDAGDLARERAANPGVGG